MGRRRGARRLLLPVDFGEPTGDMGMLGLELKGMVKSRASFVKLPLHQARVPVHKGIVRDVLMGPTLGRNAKGVRLSVAPTPPAEPPYTYNDDQHHDHETHSISFPGLSPCTLHILCRMTEGMSLA
jgi:hypothetical protein